MAMSSQQHNGMVNILCPRCGAKNRIAARFCAECGSPLPIQNVDYHTQFAQLRQNLVDYFSISELQTLCFDLGVDYDLLPGEGKYNKARELVYYVIRRNLESEFVSICRQSRPNISWKFPQDAPNSSGSMLHSSPNTTLDRMFHEATRYQLRGDLGYALQLYRQLQHIAPTYPRIDAAIAAVERELRSGYVDRYGRVDVSRVMHLPPAAPAARPAPPARAAPRAKVGIVLAIIVVVVMLILLILFILWLRGMLG
jgi:ribosomal protein L37E